MIELKCTALTEGVQLECMLRGSVKTISRELSALPAALLGQYIDCMHKNRVPQDVTRKMVEVVIQSMVDEIKEYMSYKVKAGEL